MARLGSGGKWADLSRRIASTAVLLVLGLVLALSQGLVLRLTMAAIIALTFWELARLTRWYRVDSFPRPYGGKRAFGLGLMAALSLFLALVYPAPWSLILLLVPVIGGWPGAVERDRVAYALFGTAIMAVGYGLVWLREVYGLPFILWLMGVVIISDIAGYFAGRMIGGPKFWPRLSPKKTWSGTIAGWIGVALFGAFLWSQGWADPAVIWLSPVVCLAGQLGDIAESWLKRRAGVKDSSNLIPGHGGFMDRFDAVTGAVLAVLVISALTNLPAVGGG